MNRPLLVFDTNVLMDLLLDRDGGQAVLLVTLAEAGHIQLTVPEYVLLEFRGTALRWARSETIRLNQLQSVSNEWGRSGELAAPAAEIKAATQAVGAKLKGLPVRVDEVIDRIRSVATVPKHSPEVHFRGDLRYLEGRPPDRPVDGLKDCRIYEAVLEIARAEAGENRRKALVTRDSDFDSPELTAELKLLGFELQKDLGKLFGELLATAGITAPVLP